MTSVARLILGAEDLEDFSSEELPLALIVWIFKLVKHILEELVANSLIFAVIIDGDLKSDEAKLLILENVQEKIRGLKISDPFVNSFDSVARVEDIELFLTFLCWLSLNDSILVDVLFEAFSDIWLT